MNKVILPKQKAITIFLVFALGYYISNLLRAITATISPNLISEFNLSAGDLGLLGGGYFLGFAAVQIPLGYLLDNKGPKKIVSYFLLIAVFRYDLIFFIRKFYHTFIIKNFNWSRCGSLFDGSINCL